MKYEAFIFDVFIVRTITFFVTSFSQLLRFVNKANFKTVFYFQVVFVI